MRLLLALAALLLLIGCPEERRHASAGGDCHGDMDCGDEESCDFLTGKCVSLPAVLDAAGGGLDAGSDAGPGCVEGAACDIGQVAYAAPSNGVTDVYIYLGEI